MEPVPLVSVGVVRVALQHTFASFPLPTAMDRMLNSMSADRTAWLERPPIRRQPQTDLFLQVRPAL